MTHLEIAGDDELGLVHPAFDPTAYTAAGADLDPAALTDQQRLALVLQGAAVLAHLEHAGGRLADPWEGARLGAEGELLLPPPVPGRPRDLPQVHLLHLVRRLFRTDGEIAGRGEARRAARWLCERWRQVLVPSSPDQAVADVLDAAAFLWQPPFAVARVALVAIHRRGERAHLWVAGPGAHRRRLLAQGDERAALAALLAGPRALDVWEGLGPDEDPRALAAAGQWRRAVAAFRRRPPRRGEQVVDARCQVALGLYAQALESLRGQSGFEAQLLRLECQLELGELAAAEAGLQRLAASELGADPTLRLAELAVRLLGRRGQRAASRDWVARAFAAAGDSPARRPRAELVAAEAAWDEGDAEAVARCLEQARPALDDPEVAPRWRQVRSLLAMMHHDGAAVVRHTEEILRDRRHLAPAAAGRRWSDLAYGRVLAGDLAGAERAARHAWRLFAGGESPSRHTLGLANLAEVMLRRGRVAGVAEALELSTAENRRAGNHQGHLGDLELWVRLELAQGRPTAALTRVSEALERISASGLGARRSVFELLAARAHGWLGRPAQAAARLERIPAETLFELEPEERPAVWALAGRADRAAEAAADTPFEPLWSAHLAGLEPEPRAWDALALLEPFRAARLVFDVESLGPGTVPSSWVRQAAASLRGLGADGFVERLEGRSLSPWRAVERFLGGDDGQIAELFDAAGYGDVRLVFRRHGREQVLVAGGGGREEHRVPHDGGEVVLRAPAIDPVVRVLALLARRRIAPRREAGPPPAAGAVVGKSAVLRQALARLDRLAVGRLPVLILGESGTGKELAARRVHAGSPRADGPFLPVNCAALPETLIQSDLFGHIRGAFTGADRDRAGVFESARGGTVFLDEIGDLPLNAQGKLLRVLQEGEIRRVGESYARKVDVRLVTATHRDLEAMVRAGEFREDLFFRLRVATIRLPPLRERGDDVTLLAEHFLSRVRDGGRLTISKAARQHLLAHGWPGNVRELENVLEVAAALADDGEILAEHLELPEPSSAIPAGGYHQSVKQYRRDLVRDALAASGGNRAEAARRLGLSRQALSYLVRELDID